MNDEQHRSTGKNGFESALENAMRNATRFTHNHDVTGATRLIMRALSGQEAPLPAAAYPRAMPPLTDSSSDLASQREGSHDSHSFRATGRPRNPLGTVLDLLRRHEIPAPGLGITTPPGRAPDSVSFLTRSHDCAAGSRDYRLYLPAAHAGRSRGLVVMLHGCSQTPDDFAAGTAMNELAEKHCFIVAYPRQAPNANHSGCWNWFNPTDQARDLGEPSIIAGLTRALVHEFGIDDTKVFVAGLSAGGAMAAILATTYPDLFRAAGIHSGLAYGAASDLVSAFAAMRGTPMPSSAQQKRSAGRSGDFTRTIVFHGTSDQTVHPSNGTAIFASARAHLNGAPERTLNGCSRGGLAYRRHIVMDSDGRSQLEHWQIDGLGHAWSGGRPEGSYTDGLGPDASREMVRFFFAGDRPASE
jgi:poly(hydroxyalkanoate) depolymerase family esterase